MFVSICSGGWTLLFVVIDINLNLKYLSDEVFAQRGPRHEVREKPKWKTEIYEISPTILQMRKGLKYVHTIRNGF